ncbi:MAG: dihydropyrimidinase [Phycisphaerae bacterium]|nr:dihydropyrimidinase [Phycisphaerae bacterium]
MAKRFDTIIAGGTVVTADRLFKADVAIVGKKIVAVSNGLVQQVRGQRKGSTKTSDNGPVIIDAAGKYVMPGAIDVHVHLDMPFCGTVSSDDYNTGTKAAARGGVTTVIDFVIPTRDESLAAAVDRWHAKAEAKACVDYSFHVCITNPKQHIAEIPALIRSGIPTVKEFMIYADQGWQADDGDTYETLEVVRDHGGMLMVHAESARVLDLLIARHHNAAEMRKYGAKLHTMTRPNVIEAEAIQRAITWAEATGGPLYIVHMSTSQGADLVTAAQDKGIDVLAETCAHYLTLDDSLFGRKDGHLYATCPQLKKPEDQHRLWKGLKRGEISIISTDTCSFTREQKAMWKGDWTKIPMGMPGLETLVPVVFTHGVQAKRLTLKEMVEKLSTNPAKIMGLYPRKGIIAPGSDADIAIIDPKHNIKVDYRTMETNADWNPFQGWSLAGFAEKTFCRGQLIVDDYRFIGRNGWGKFQKRRLPS